VKFYNLYSPDDETSSKQEKEENLTNLTKEMQKFGRGVFEICAQTDRHADMLIATHRTPPSRNRV